MKTKKPLTLEEREKIERLYYGGYAVNEIAKEIGRPYSTTFKEIRKNTVNGNYNAFVAQAAFVERIQKTAANARETYRNNCATRRKEGRPPILRKKITFIERQVIEKMLRMGHSPADVSRALNRSRSVVIREIPRGTVDGAYSAAEAEANSVLCRKISNQNVFPPRDDQHDFIPPHHRVAISDGPEPEEPENIWEKAEDKQIELIKEKNLEERVRLLEEYVTIITDILKEKK